METKRGRPPKKPLDLHTERLEIRFTKEESKSLERAAERSGGKMATWAREALLKAAKRS
jgi:uncharacterized protein (DUF1778 family)